MADSLKEIILHSQEADLPTGVPRRVQVMPAAAPTPTTHGSTCPSLERNSYLPNADEIVPICLSGRALMLSARP